MIDAYAKRVFSLKRRKSARPAVAGAPLLRAIDRATKTVTKVCLANENTAAVMNIADMNAEALRKRSADIDRLFSRKGEVEEFWLFESLENEIKGLETILRLVREGNGELYVDILNKIRKLICRGGKNMNPLLQTCAGILDISLIIYVPWLKADMPLFPGSAILISAPSSIMTDHFKEPIDIDVWLEDFGGSIDKKLFSNNNVIRAFADTLGAHLDPDKHEFLKLVNLVRDLPIPRELERDHPYIASALKLKPSIESHMMQIADVVVYVAKELLAHTDINLSANKNCS